MQIFREVLKGVRLRRAYICNDAKTGRDVQTYRDLKTSEEIGWPAVPQRYPDCTAAGRRRSSKVTSTSSRQKAEQQGDRH